MSMPRWSVASAKAGLSRLVEDAQRQPQVIERRGKAVAVVMAIEQFEEHDPAVRWRRFLELSEKIRKGGGADIRVGRRARRASPLGRA